MFEMEWIVDPRLRAAAELPAGGAQLDAVRALDATGLSHGDRLIALELWERSEAAVTADKQHLFAALSHGGDAPGELAGYGPIPAPLARTLAHQADSRWRRLVPRRLLSDGPVRNHD